MSSWLLLLFLFVVWFVWAGALAVQRSTEDAGRRIPEGERGGVSIAPVIPLFPLAFGGIAQLIDLGCDPVGTWSIGGFHILFVVALIDSITRNLRRLHELDSHAS